MKECGEHSNGNSSGFKSTWSSCIFFVAQVSVIVFRLHKEGDSFTHCISSKDSEQLEGMMRYSWGDSCLVEIPAQRREQFNEHLNGIKNELQG